jgi:DNA-directed RNA polymerase specialized sigma24 family protein
MTTQEWLIPAGAAAVGAAAAILVAWIARRFAPRRGAPGRADLESMRRLAVRLRRLEQVARRTQHRVGDHVEELRRLLSEAEDLCPQPPPGGEPPRSLQDEEPVLPGILEKQRDQVFRLRFQGLEAIDIARRLALPVGEVELTLKLRDQQARAEAGP